MIMCQTPPSPPLSPSPEGVSHLGTDIPSPPLSPSPLSGCSEILQGVDGVIKMVIKNNKMYFSYTKADELDLIVSKLEHIQINESH